MLKPSLVLLVFQLLCLLGRTGDLMHDFLNYEEFGIVYDIIEKDNNTLYIAAERGVFRYSGKVLTRLKMETDEVFHKLENDGEKLFALSFDDNVFCAKKDSLIPIFDFNVNQRVNSFFVENDVVYISTPDSIYKGESNKKQSTIQLNKTDEYNFGFIKVNYKHYLFVQENEGVVFREPNTKKEFRLSFNKELKKVFFNNQSNSFLSGNKVYSVNSFKETPQYEFDLPLECIDVKIYDIKLNVNEFFHVLAHNNGVSIYNKKQRVWKHYFSKIPAHVILKDYYGSLWIGTKFEGLIRVPSMDVFQKDIGLILNEKIVASYEANNLLFLGTGLGKVAVYNLFTDRLDIISLNNSGEVQSMYYRDNLLYVYCDKLYEINIKTKKIERVFEVHSTKSIYVDDDIYCATAGDFQSLLARKKISKGVWHNYIYYDSLARVFYIGTKSGYKIFDKSSFKEVENKSSSELKIISIQQINKTLYFFSSKGEVYNKDLRLMFKLPMPVLNGITVLNNTSFLAYNNEKVVHFSLKNNLAVPLNLFNKIIKKEALININVKGDSLLVVSDKKVYLIKNYKEFFKPQRYKDVVLNVAANLKYTAKDNVELSYNNNGVIFNVSTNRDLSYFFDYNLFYTLGKNGTKKAISPNKENKYILNIEILPEGHYDLVFELRDKRGRFIDEHKISITVASPFWKSMWFILLVFSFFIASLILFQRRKIENIKANNLKKIQEEQLKTRLVRSELTAIRSQMNPHFVFNTLSAIQLKIARNEGKMAFKMVQKFSSLMRGVLMFSQFEVITLKEELGILNHYLDLEKERFDEENLTITVNLDERIDVNDFKIPSIITQPIVENSLQHGLRHKEGDKKLVVNLIKVSQSSYIVEIIDNGVGIEAAKKINDYNNQKQSFAMEAIKKRIKYVNSLGQLFVSMEVKSNNEGTVVKITVNSYD